MPKPSQGDLDQALETLQQAYLFYLQEEQDVKQAVIILQAFRSLGHMHKATATFEETLRNLKEKLDAIKRK